MSNPTEKITADGKLLAVVVRSTFNEPGVSFLTPDEFPFQMGMHLRPKDTHVEPHEHKPFTDIKLLPTQEFFYIIDGKVQVNLFHKKKKHTTITLNKGDMILLNTGHEVIFLEETKIVELKQGPYRGKSEEKEFYGER